ncbi:50S ribosomal protein L31 [Mycoplasma sp. Mirounga ES2805-ORL]|uniref:50S ribosomal protein L31 n=1 Tax=Mycoplasma sp. Mirounga ES2805-ORL TaxID=754514 RepID=UPI00197BF1A4|nr:50S ribosomal protein L31 [Mycoplasma sp. Mirounga ES2805-ORL]QSF13737.1 50S ribosomal protein L31 [Mycoplasma sp. Mirounga ES2805-ORL]
MKKDIHPKYNNEVNVECSTCHKKFTFGSTSSKINVDVCSGCHVVYTGDKAKNKATGNIDKFNKRFAKYQEKMKK